MTLSDEIERKIHLKNQVILQCDFFIKEKELDIKILTDLKEKTIEEIKELERRKAA